MRVGKICGKVVCLKGEEREKTFKQPTAAAALAEQGLSFVAVKVPRVYTGADYSGSGNGPPILRTRVRGKLGLKPGCQGSKEERKMTTLTGGVSRRRSRKLRARTVWQSNQFALMRAEVVCNSQ